MVTHEDLKDLGLSEDILNKIVTISDNKFAIEKSKIENETFGKTLGEVDNVLIDLGFEKKGKTTEFIKNVFSDLKTKTSRTDDLIKEIETLKKGTQNADVVKELEKKNKDLANLLNETKKKSAESLAEKEKEFNSKLKVHQIRSKISNKGLEHLPESLQQIILNDVTSEIAKFDTETDEKGNFIFKDANGVVKVNEKDGYKPKTLQDMLMEIPIYKESYKEVGQKATKINKEGETVITSNFETKEQVNEYLKTQNLTVDEFSDKYIELTKDMK